MLLLQGIAYAHPNKDVLFTDISLSLQAGDKTALIGNNGIGKSTLLKIIAGQLEPTSGTLKTETRPYYVPQHFGQYDQLLVAEAMGVADKLRALQSIMAGDPSLANFDLLNDDWTIEERCREALAHWELSGLSLDQPVHNLSGGQKTKLFLAGIQVNDPAIVLLDEPSNHLDVAGRQLLYDYIRSTRSTLVVVSHDRRLLNLLDCVVELSKQGIQLYGGNYDFYEEQKRIEEEALLQDVKSKEKELRKAKQTEREAMERQQRLDARGKKKQEKAGLPTISMNTFRNNAEKTASKLKATHASKLDGISQEIDQLRKELPDADLMRLNFDDSTLHKGKLLMSADKINFRYNDRSLWKQPLNFEIMSGDRIVIKGSNGSGKTTLVKLILGVLQPTEGVIRRNINRAIYIDQDYSLLNDRLSVFEQAQQYNTGALPEHAVKNQLNRFLFTKDFWDKPCSALSGGERMRLCLCCLSIGVQAPDLIILDEPTNNLDIRNTGILAAAIGGYRGSLLVISHDERFLEEIGIAGLIDLG